MVSLRSLEIIGVHQVIPTEEQIEPTVAIQYGADLSARELAQARDQVREQFAGLYLLEMEIDPPDADLDWAAITQPVRGQPRSNWQAPYDEQCLNERGNRWAFFFHFLDLTRPLRTPLGDRVLPEVSPTPEHLRSIVYDVPA